MEYLVVKFAEPRKVTVNGFIFGLTNTILQIEAGTHTVALEPPTGSRPLRQTIVVVGTTPLSPAEVTFHPDPGSS